MMVTDLDNILKGHVVLVGIGNILKGDDGAGPALIERLQGKTSLICIDAGTAPESYAGKIVKAQPDTVILIDAVHLDKEPGAFDLLGKDDVVKSGLTTHDLSPKMFIEYLEAQTKATIYLLGIQSKTMQFGDDISLEVNRALDDIERMITCTKHT